MIKPKDFLCIQSSAHLFPLTIAYFLPVVKRCFIYRHPQTSFAETLYMKLYTSTALFAIISWMLFTACNTTTPEKYFDVAVLNMNLIRGFADDMMMHELSQPSVKLVEGTTDKTEPQKRIEVIESKIRTVEENYKKVKNLSATDETKDMIRASLELYEYVLPVYKTEYTELAKSFDADAPFDRMHTLAVALREKYNSGYTERMNKLVELGKKYASDNSINVKWD